MNENTFVRDCLIASLFTAGAALLWSLPSGLEKRPEVQSGAVFGALPASAAELPTPPQELPEHQVAAVAPLVVLVADGESATVGDYNAANAGRAMDLGKHGLKNHFGRDCSEVVAPMMRPHLR